MKLFRQTLANWLVHSILLWLVINLVTVGPFLYREATDGAYLYYADGSAVTGWEYFLDHNFNRAEMLVMLVFVFFTEMNYRYSLKNNKLRLPVAGLLCLVTGVFSFVLLKLLSGGFGAAAISAGWEPLLFSAGYALVYLMIRDYFMQLRHKNELRTQQSESELKALKAQLNPHFLFNSLNYLYGTALQEDAPRTSEGIDKLSEMLRYVLTGIDKNLVSLSEELKFVEHFIALQQVRLPQKDLIQAKIPVPAGIPENASQEDLKIAPLLLLPLIENAFKYGISIDRPDPVQIKIDIAGNRLHLETSNQLLSEPMEVLRNGTGIANVRKRLEIMYPGKYSLECKAVDQTYTATLLLQLN